MCRYPPCMNKMPVPPSGPMHGPEAKMQLKGSAGRIALPVDDLGNFDPTTDRCNETGLDQFSGGGESY